MGRRCTVRTLDGYLGTLEIADGVDVADVLRAARAQRLFVVPDDDDQAPQLEAVEQAPQLGDTIADVDDAAPSGKGRGKGRRS